MTSYKQDTIFAPATPMVKSGVAILRISGRDARAALTALISGTSFPKARQATLRRLYSPHTGELLDSALVLWFPAPHSFTGEDTVELQLHGSRAVMQGLLRILAQMPGLRPAEAGEFARRAFFNGKMDLTEAEGLSDLIEAETEQQARLAQRQMAGELHDLYAKWREKLILSMAQVEAYIDFPEEDIPDHVIMDIKNNITVLQKDINEHITASKPAERLREGLVVVIVGAPNVGKSSLLNALAQRDVAIISDIAGTTRDSLEIHLDVYGYPVMVIDTAGLRKGRGKVEKLGIARSLQKAKDADLLLAVMDATLFSKKPSKGKKAITPDEETVTLLKDPKAVPIFNKCDRATPPKAWKAGDKAPLCLSAKTGEGVEALLRLLHERAEALLSVPASPVLTRERHRLLLQETLTALSGIAFDRPPELIAEQLRLAATALGKIIGVIDVEDILDALFSQFCIGK